MANEGFGTDLTAGGIFDNWSATSDKGLLKEREKRMAGALLPILYGGYNKLATEGIYSDAEIENIMRRIRAAQAVRRMQSVMALKNTAARRLGTRGGTLNTLMANAQQPYDANMYDMLGSLYDKKYTSRLGGLQGLQGLRDSTMSGVGAEWWKGRPKGGAMDFIKGAAAIGGLVAAPATGGASLAVTGAAAGGGGASSLGVTNPNAAFDVGWF